MGRVILPQDLVQRPMVGDIAEAGADVGVDVLQLCHRPDLLHIPVPPIAQVGGDAAQPGEGPGHRQQPPRAGHVDPRVPHVGDEEHIVPLHLLEHGKQPLVVQNEALELRVDLHAEDAVLPHPAQLVLIPLIPGVEGTAGDQLPVEPGLLQDIAVDALHLVGGGGGGEHHGIIDPRVIQHGGQLIHGAEVVGRLRQTEVVHHIEGRLPRHLIGENMGMHVNHSHNGSHSLYGFSAPQRPGRCRRAYWLAIRHSSSSIFGSSAAIFSSLNWQVPTFLCPPPLYLSIRLPTSREAVRLITL